MSYPGICYRVIIAITLATGYDSDSDSGTHNHHSVNFPVQSQSRVCYYMDPRAPDESCLLGHARVPRHSTSAPAKILVNTYAIIPLRIRGLRVCVCVCMFTFPHTIG